MGLSDIALNAGQLDRTGQEPADIIEFIESSWGLNISLYPVQRVILKAHYGLALDDNDPFIITNWRRGDPKYFTEKEYLEFLFSQERSNIKEVIPGVQRRELVLSIGRRSGKCILGGSLILTDGGIRRIQEMGNPDGPESQPLEVGVAQEGHKRSRSAYFYNGGLKPTRTLTTHCGYQLGGTDNHRIKVLTEQGVVDWCYLADLKVGDAVCIHRNTDLWASEPVDCTPYHNTEGSQDLPFPSYLDEDWGRLLGYLVGDGLWNANGRVDAPGEHPETWDTLKALFTQLLGGNSMVWGKHVENPGAIKFGSIGMRKFLHDLGFNLGTDRDAKMVPWSILQSPRPVVQAFLRGLFETDGWVEPNGQAVSVSMASGRLAHEVQTLLLNLGIISHIKPQTTKSKVYWVLTIRGLRHRRAFAERVGFDSLKKRAPLLASLMDARREGGDAESIPHQRGWCARLLGSVPKIQPGSYRTQTWGRSALREVLGNTIKPSTVDAMTYARLAEVLPVARQLGADPGVISHFEHLQALDYYFDTVEDIEEGTNPVFDLTVPDGESFVANGMTNHNTFLCACVVAYEVYKLLLKGDPQSYYGVPKTNTIGLISVATDKEQAGLLYTEASGHFSECVYFKPYTANNTMSYAKFQTPADIKRFGRYVDDPTAKATIKVSFKSCIAKGLRGAGNIVIILDELAHFNEAGQSDALKIYRAVKPSLAAFSPKDPKTKMPRQARGPDGKRISVVEGRLLSISSPLGKQGFFFQKFRQGFTGGLESQNMLCIQAPSWEVNPTIEATFLAEEYATDPVSFFTEYGADFTDRTSGWLEPEHLLACVDPRLRPANKAPLRAPHFLGLDISAGKVDGDYCAAALGHLDDAGRVVLDLIERIRAGEGDYKSQDKLSFDDITEWLFNLSRRFYISSGLFDQWAGLPFEMALHNKGLTQCKSVFFTKQLSSQVFQNFKDLMYEHKLVLYDWPVENSVSPDSAHSAHINELLELQKEVQSKYLINVEAPQVKGKFDDMSDALVRMVWEATQYLGKRKYIAGNIGRGPQQHQSDAGYLDVARAQKKARVLGRLGGSSPDRQRSPLNRNAAQGRR